MTGQENCLTKLVKKQKAFSEGAIPNAILLAAVTQKFGSMALESNSDLIKPTNPYTWAINGTIATFATNKALGLVSGVAMDRLGKKQEGNDEQDNEAEAASLPFASGDEKSEEKQPSCFEKGLKTFSKIAGSNEVTGLLYTSIAQTFTLSTVAPESDPSLNGEHDYKRYLNGSISVFAAVIATGLMAKLILNGMKKENHQNNRQEETDVETIEGDVAAKEEEAKKGFLKRFKSFALNDNTDLIINSAAAARFGAAGFAPDSDIAATTSTYMKIFNGTIACSAALMSAGLVATSIINSQKKNNVEVVDKNDELGDSISSSSHAKKIELTRGKKESTESLSL